MGWTERKIQEALAHWVIQKNHHAVIPNCGVFGWEADLISVTQNGMANEYEVKISRSDFLADAKKRKHWWLNKAGIHKNCPGPVYFWYCCPKGLVKESEIPDHAGFLEIVDGGYVVLRKRALRLHKTSISENQLQYIHRGLMLRYWKQKEDI
jgi:hypothetical protein